MKNAAQCSPQPDTQTEEATFATRSIYNQLHGTPETPAVEHMNSLVLPEMNTSQSKTAESGSADHQIVFVSIPNVSKSAPVDDDSQMKVIDVPDLDTINAARELGQQSKSEISAMVDKIFERFPLAASTVLLFVGTEENPHVDETCARVASAIASRNIGNVLLVDADVDGRRLTQASGLSGQTGLLECINRSQNWRQKVVSRDESSFGFLPVGVCPMDRWNAKQLLINSVAEMKQDYQFVCVSAGSAHSPHAKLWYDVCEGSYLVVSLRSSNETYAKSSVKELQDGGARLLGCVVTDVN
jgi:Mrp family chromosome partitioning ATPase